MNKLRKAQNAGGCAATCVAEKLLALLLRYPSCLWTDGKKFMDRKIATRATDGWTHSAMNFVVAESVRSRRSGATGRMREM